MKKINKIFIYLLIASSFQPIFSMEQNQQISEQQLKVQQKLKESIAKFDLKAVKIAFAQGAKVNLETPTIVPNFAAGDTTPIADALVLTHLFLGAFKKNALKSKNALLAGAIISFTAGVASAALTTYGARKEIPGAIATGIIAAFISIFLYGAFLGYYSQLSYTQKTDKEAYKTIMQILKLIINRKEFELDEFSKNLCTQFDPELNKIVKTLIVKKSQTQNNNEVDVVKPK